MTLSEVIAKVSQMRPSEYDKDDLTSWLNELEFMAYDQVIGHSELETEQEDYEPYVYAEDAEKTLLIPDQFSACYMDYLFSKIDYFNGEIDRYNMEAVVFENDFQKYAAWYRRTHKPKEVKHDTTIYNYSPLS